MEENDLSRKVKRKNRIRFGLIYIVICVVLGIFLGIALEKYNFPMDLFEGIPLFIKFHLCCWNLF